MNKKSFYLVCYDKKINEFIVQYIIDILYLETIVIKN